MDAHSTRTGAGERDRGRSRNHQTDEVFLVPGDIPRNQGICVKTKRI